MTRLLALKPPHGQVGPGAAICLGVFLLVMVAVIWDIKRRGGGGE